MARHGVGGADAWPPHAADLASYWLKDVRGCAVVGASGEIDVATAPGLRDALDTAAQQSGRIVLDLSEVTFLDSKGMDAMIGALGPRSPGIRAVRVVGASSMVRTVLDVTGLSALFPLCASLDEAVGQLTALHN
jgi:anti-sigma B factor antagonist